MGVNDANMDLFSCNSTTVAWKLETAFISLAFSLIFLVGTVGNCLVLAVLFRTGKMNTKTTSLFIFNLGIADLSFIVFCVPFQATIYTMDEWVFGPVFCKVVHFLIFLTMHASIFTLAAVSLDRYQAICYPLHSRQMRTPRNALASISLVWLLALLFSGPYLSYYRQVELGGGRACLPVWEPAPRLAMDMCTLVFGYLLPFAVLGVTYARTVRHLWTSADPPRTPDMSESRRAKRRVTKMLIAVAALFGLCWLPHHLLVLCMWFGPFPLNHTTYALRILSHLLAYMNSCLNPVVYALVSRHFRKGFGKLFCCALKKRPGNRPHAASRKAVHTASSAETSN